MNRIASVLLVLAVLGAAAGMALAADGAAERPTDLVARVDIAQQLGEPLPLEARFHDETGREVELGAYFGGRPVVLAMVYYECPMLCTLVLNGLLRAVKPLSLDVGTDFEVVVISFDAEETPALARAKKAAYVEAYGRTGSGQGWHFLTGEEPQIDSVAEALGFRYAYDERRDEYAHGAAIYVATGEGRIARYFFGVEYAPRDLKLGLVEAADGRIGSLVDRLLLLCYHYDPATGSYSAVALGALRAASLVTIVAMVVLFAALRRRNRGAA